MKRIKINQELELTLVQLLERGFVVENGAKTRPIVRAFKDAGIRIHNGYCQGTEKVILALDQEINKVLRRKNGFDSSVFDLEL